MPLHCGSDLHVFLHGMWERLVLNTGAFFSLCLPTSSLYIFVHSNEGFLLPAIMELPDNNPAKQTQTQTNKPIISALVFPGPL